MTRPIVLMKPIRPPSLGSAFADADADALLVFETIDAAPPAVVTASDPSAMAMLAGFTPET
jgi:hypothetical protein